MSPRFPLLFRGDNQRLVTCHSVRDHIIDTHARINSLQETQIDDSNVVQYYLANVMTLTWIIQRLQCYRFDTRIVEIGMRKNCKGLYLWLGLRWGAVLEHCTALEDLRCLHHWPECYDAMQPILGSWHSIQNLTSVVGWLINSSKADSYDKLALCHRGRKYDQDGRVGGERSI